MFIAMPDESDSSVIPDWVPELAPGTRADVYPVDGRTRSPFAELVLDRDAVTAGYSERKQAYEFWSCLSGNPEFRSSAVPLAAPPGALALASDGEQDKLSRMLTKTRTGVVSLRRARPSKLQRVELETIPAPGPSAALDVAKAAGTGTGAERKKATFPYQIPSASLDDWFNKLSKGGSFSTAELAATVPLGPRAAGKVLERMAGLTVPIQRAAWYIRIAVLNECVKQMRPDKQPLKPRDIWTRQLCNLLKTELDAIRARKAASLGNMDRLQFWNYALDLARWQMDENLLDPDAWLDRIAASVRTELLSSPTIASNGAKIAIAAVQRFLPQFCADRLRTQRLRDALKPAAAYLLAAAYASLHGTAAPRRGKVRQPHSPLASTTSQPAFNNAAVRMAAFLGNVGSVGDALARLNADPPESFTDMAVIDKALEIVTERKMEVPASEAEKGDPGFTAESSPSKAKGKKAPIWDGPSGSVLPLDAIAALEEFPAVGNPTVLRAVLRRAFVGRGGDRAAVEHVCKWAIAASALDVSQVVATAAAAIDILADPATGAAAATAVKGEGVPEPLVKKPSTQSTDTAVSNSRPAPAAAMPLPVFHREIWLFLKDLDDEDDRETVVFDDRVAWLISRLCRVGVFSLSAFVRDVARLASLAHHSSARLVRYVQLLPEPDDRPSADARRALLRRNGLLPSRADEAELTAVAEKVVRCIRIGEELASIKEGARLKQSGDTRVLLAIVDAVVGEVSEIQDEKPEKVGLLLRPTVSFLRAAGASSLGADFLLDRMARLLALAAEKSRPQGLGNSVCVAFLAGVECMSQLAPVFAATNRLAAALGVLGRLWNVGVGGAAQQRFRTHIERTALVFGKFFCGRPASDHTRWKEFVVTALPNANFATSKQLYCALLAGHLQSLIPQMETLQKPQLHSIQALMASSTQCIAQNLNNYKWHSSGLDQLQESKKSKLQTALVDRIDISAIDRFYKELVCVNHVAEGVIIPVLRVSARPNSVTNGDDAYRTAVDNITNILGSVWMEALGDEMRPVFAIEIVALIVVGALYEYSGASSALEALISRPWLQRLTALHAGKPCFDRLQRIVIENLPSNAGITHEAVADLLFSTVSAMCGKSHQDEGGIIRGIGLEPLGATQMQLCAQFAARAARGSEEDFGNDAWETLVTMVSKDECAVVTKMILQCYQKGPYKVATAGNIGLRAVEAMAQSLGFFVTAVTVENPENNFLNQQRSSEWSGADEARRAILHAAAEHVGEEQCVQIADAVREQMINIAVLLTDASEKKCLPRDVSADGIRISDAIAARVQTLLVLCRKNAKALRWEGVACAAARVLKAAVALLSPQAVDGHIELLGLCVAQVDALERTGEGASGVAPVSSDILGASVDGLGDGCDVHGPDMLRTELAHILVGIDAWLEPPHAKALRKASGEPVAAGLRHTPVAARDADGADVDTWYLLEGYGRGECEQPSIPVAAFAAQSDAVDAVKKNSVRLKRTYSTFLCLVR